MPKRKHKRPVHPPSAISPAALKQRGLTAFHQNDLTTAINEWSRLDPETEPTGRLALAEAHFRRALAARGTPEQSLADLTRAVELAPTEARYWYHLGLVQHRAYHLAEASNAYARAAAIGFPRHAFGFVRGLAEIERNPSLDLETLNWLSADDRAALFPIAALLRGEPQALLAPNANGFARLQAQLVDNPTLALWRGLAHLSTGQVAQAREALASPSGRSLPAEAEAMRAFYHGMALAQMGNEEAALPEWTTAASRDPTPRLQAAIARAYLRQVRARLEAGHWSEALTAANAALKLVPGHPVLVAPCLVAHNRLANEAAARNDWTEAVAHWREMRAVLSVPIAPSLGPIAPILRNLAIAHERLEEWEAAAEDWIALMGTLPRREPKGGAKTAKSYPVVEQRNWLRRRVLECYKKANRPEQAITHYRQAVKANPDDLDLRLELADALLANNQMIAGRNELNRILEKNPDHQEARLRLAEVHRQRGELYAAEQLLCAALESDPQLEVARRGLIELMRERGHTRFNAGFYAEARVIYEEALRFAPQDTELLASIGYAELLLKDEAAARRHFEAALAKGDAAAYLKVFERWVCVGKLQDARQVLTRAQAAGVASPHFYVDAAGACFTQVEPPDPAFGLFGPPLSKKRQTAANAWEKLGRELLQKAEGASGDREGVLRHAVAALVQTQPALALEYAQKLAQHSPADPWVLATLGLLQAMNDQGRAAKDNLRRAAHLARQQGDQQLVNQIEDLRREINHPLFGMLAKMLPRLGPLDEFDFDDEDFFR